jgi:hypothetical protein
VTVQTCKICGRDFGGDSDVCFSCDEETGAPALIDRVAVLEHANRALARGIKVLRRKLDRARALHIEARAELRAQKALSPGDGIDWSAAPEAMLRVKRRRADLFGAIIADDPPAPKLTPEQEASRRHKMAEFAERMDLAGKLEPPPRGPFSVLVARHHATVALTGIETIEEALDDARAQSEIGESYPKAILDSTGSKVIDLEDPAVRDEVLWPDDDDDETDEGYMSHHSGSVEPPPPVVLTTACAGCGKVSHFTRSEALAAARDGRIDCPACGAPVARFDGGEHAGK